MGKLDDLTISLAAETTFRTCHRWLHASREGVEQVAWRRPWSTSTRPARQGEDGDDAYYAPARYSPLGALSPAPGGLRWTSHPHPYLPVAPWRRLRRPRGRVGRALVATLHTVPEWALECYIYTHHWSGQCLTRVWHSVPSAGPVLAYGWHSSAQCKSSASLRLALQCPVS